MSPLRTYQGGQSGWVVLIGQAVVICPPRNRRGGQLYLNYVA